MKKKKKTKNKLNTTPDQSTKDDFKLTLSSDLKFFQISIEMGWNFFSYCLNCIKKIGITLFTWMQKSVIFVCQLICSHKRLSSLIIVFIIVSILLFIAHDKFVKHQQVLMNKSVSNIRNGNIAEAKHLLEKIWFSQDIKATSQSMIYLVQHQLDELIKQISTFEDPQASIVLKSSVALCRGEIDQAISGYSQILENPDIKNSWMIAESAYGLGKAHFVKHFFKDASKAFDVAIHTEPEFVSSYLFKAMIEYHLGRFQEYMNHYQQAKQLLLKSQSKNRSSRLLQIFDMLAKTTNKQINCQNNPDCTRKYTGQIQKYLIQSQQNAPDNNSSNPVKIVFLPGSFFDPNFYLAFESKWVIDQIIYHMTQNEFIHPIDPMIIFWYMKRFKITKETIKDWQIKEMCTDLRAQRFAQLSINNIDDSFQIKFRVFNASTGHMQIYTSKKSQGLKDIKNFIQTCAQNFTEKLKSEVVFDSKAEMVK